MTQKFASIADLAVHFPDLTLSNDDLSLLFPEWPAEKIYEKTGIRNRYIAEPGQTAADLAFEAALKIFANGKVSVDDIDFIILCTQAPDYILPTTACILQTRLGIKKNSGALDINLGCSGFVYGLSLAKGLIESGSASGVLLLTADTYSKYIHPNDKSVRTLFGDAAAATVIIAKECEEPEISSFLFGTDGSGAKNLIVEAGLFRNPQPTAAAHNGEVTSKSSVSQETLYMNGPEIMSFSLREVPKAVSNILIQSGIGPNDIDFFVFHQANKFMLEAIRKKIGIPPEKMPIMMSDCGNTVSSTIPVTMYKMLRSGMLSRSSRLMLVGFGVGYSWGGCLVNFFNNDKAKNGKVH
jgi:3-oxoacyl-[acyl-carrier-protein] synthase-3